MRSTFQELLSLYKWRTIPSKGGNKVPLIYAGPYFGKFYAFSINRK